MTEPSRRSSRIRLAVSAAAASLLLAAGFMLGRTTSGRPTTPVIAEAPLELPPEAESRPSLPVAPLGRRELLAAVTAAADAHASGGVALEEGETLVGRRFELRIPFGCYGPTPEGGAPLRWNYDGTTETLRVSATPIDWSADERVRALKVQSGVEGVEGYWLPRPWTTSETCPPSSLRATLPPIAPEPPRTVGIAQFTDEGASRVLQRDGKAMEAVVKVAPGELDTSEGFRLVLRGRIARLSGEQPVGCYAQGAEYRPICLIAADFDSVVIENGRTGEQLGRWEL